MLKNMKFLATLAILAFMSTGCGGETFKLFWRSKVTKPESKAYTAPNFQLSVLDTPTSSNPRITVEVRRQKFWIETATRIRMQFKKFESGKSEPVPNSETKQKIERITGKTEWIPASGQMVTFRVDRAGKESQVETDAEGKATFDVSDFAEDWVEGKNLSVDVMAQLRSINDPDSWAKVKGKPRSALKAYKADVREFAESVSVSMRTLQSIFEKR